MPEMIHWKCDWEDCDAITVINDRNEGMVGWIKLTVQAPLLEPLTQYFCPEHAMFLARTGESIKGRN